MAKKKKEAEPITNTEYINYSHSFEKKDVFNQNNAEGENVLYQPDKDIKIEVRIITDTV